MSLRDRSKIGPSDNRSSSEPEPKAGRGHECVVGFYPIRPRWKPWLLSELKVRVINVVDLMKLQPASEHPHGLSELDYDSLFTKDKPIIFNFHGYPWLVHKLTYRRTNRNLHVRGTVHSSDPKPFVWTATASDILERVKRGRAKPHNM
jgi:hypothetical protein